MVSIEKNNKRLKGDLCARLTAPGTMGPWLYVGARIMLAQPLNGGLLSNVLFRQALQIATNVPIIFEIGIVFCKVIFTNDFPIKMKSIHTSCDQLQ